MSTETERRELIDAIERLPRELESAVHGLSDAQLDTPFREGGWTVRQIVHHLADSHANALIRMKLAITEDSPTLKPYDQDRWALLADSETYPIAPSMRILEGLHERWTTLLRALPSDAWARDAMHPENGTMTLDDLLRTYGHHGANHVAQITRLRAAHGW
jgi:hypothetical protein